MTMFAFRDAIQLRGVRWCGQVSNAMSRKELTQGDELTAVIGVQSTDLVFKFVLHQSFELDESVVNLRLQLEWIQPRIASVHVNNHKIVLEAIYRHNRRRPHVRIQILKRII